MAKSKLKSDPPFEYLVVLRGRDKEPLVMGLEEERLSQAEYDTINALIEAGGSGLTLTELEETSKRPGARGILRRLKRSSPEWDAVINMAGRAHTRYRLGWPEEMDGPVPEVAKLATEQTRLFDSALDDLKQVDILYKQSMKLIKRSRASIFRALRYRILLKYYAASGDDSDLKT